MITARDFYNKHQSHPTFGEGRALLTPEGDVPQAFFKPRSYFRPSHRNPKVRWLALINDRLVLCQDADPLNNEYPVLRLVDDHERVVALPKGGFKLA